MCENLITFLIEVALIEVAYGYIGQRNHHVHYVIKRPLLAPIKLPLMSALCNNDSAHRVGGRDGVAVPVPSPSTGEFLIHSKILLQYIELRFLAILAYLKKCKADLSSSP